MRKYLEVRKWDIVLVDFKGSKQFEAKGKRPCIVVSNDMGNKHGRTHIVLPIMEFRKDQYSPTRVKLSKEMINNGNTQGYIVCDKIRVVDKSRVMRIIDKLKVKFTSVVEKALIALFDVKYKINDKGVSQGKVVYINLDGNVGSEQGKVRPCLVVSNDIQNNKEKTIVVVPIGHKKKNINLPVHVDIRREYLSGRVEGTCLCEQIITVNKNRIEGPLRATLNKIGMNEVFNSVRLAMDL